MGVPAAAQLNLQLVWLFVLAVPIACIAWTVTHEEVVREPREYCIAQSKRASTLLARKFFYLFTCEYCFSHWVTAGFLALTQYRLLIDDWRGFILAEFALVYVANFYMALYARLRLDIKSERVEIALEERQLELVQHVKVETTETLTQINQVR